jgi:hypothetical protein
LPEQGVNGSARRGSTCGIIGQQRWGAVKPWSSGDMATQAIEHFLMFWEASDALFGKNEPAIGQDIELTRFTNGQFRFYVKRFFNLGRETHGTGFVVSNVAIDDFDEHGKPPR